MFETNENWDIVDYGPCDISKIKDAVLDMILEEGSFTGPKDIIKIHKIYDFPEDWNGEDISGFEVSTNKKLLDSVEQIVSHLETFCEGTRAKVLISRLYSNEEIAGSYADKKYHLSVRRHHIPIITNDNIYIGIGQTEINMKESILYEINTSKDFVFKNHSDSDRYHLIVDILPNSQKN